MTEYKETFEQWFAREYSGCDPDTWPYIAKKAYEAGSASRGVERSVTKDDKKAWEAYCTSPESEKLDGLSHSDCTELGFLAGRASRDAEVEALREDLTAAKQVICDFEMCETVDAEAMISRYRSMLKHNTALNKGEG